MSRQHGTEQTGKSREGGFFGRAADRRRRAAVLALAVALDIAFGEPPARLHPVVWMGSAIRALDRRSPREGQLRPFIRGGAITAAVTAGAGGGALVAQRIARRAGLAGLLAEAAILNSAFAVRALLQAGERVRATLSDDDIASARDSLRSLVSRETASLAAPLVAAAAIESLAENTTDSFLAPWLAYALGGLPAAFAYRAVNTLDSMIGYRGRYEWLGKPAARIDDALNLIPARLAAWSLVLAAPVGRGSPRAAVRVARRDHARTASPNAGWTMAAMAGALGVRLEKVGAYALGDGRDPHPADIRRAARIAGAAAALSLAAIEVALIASGRITGSER